MIYNIIIYKDKLNLISKPSKWFEYYRWVKLCIFKIEIS